LLNTNMSTWTAKSLADDKDEDKDENANADCDRKKIDNLLARYMTIPLGGEFMVFVLYIKDMPILGSHVADIIQKGLRGTRLFASTRTEAVKFCAAVIFSHLKGGKEDTLKGCLGVFGEHLVFASLLAMIQAGVNLLKQDLELFFMETELRKGLDNLVKMSCSLLKASSEANLSGNKCVRIVAQILVTTVLDTAQLCDVKRLQKNVHVNFISLLTFVTRLDIAEMVIASKLNNEDKNESLKILSGEYLDDYMSETGSSKHGTPTKGKGT